METESQNLQQTHPLGLVELIRTHPAIDDVKLRDFLKSMRIPLAVAGRFASQVECRKNGKIFMALGCRNPSGNWETIGPEGIGYTGTITFVHHNANQPRIDLFNNQRDFLNVQKLRPSKLGANDSLIVAGMDQLMDALPHLKKYAQLNLYFDHTIPGNALRNCTSLLFSDRANDFSKMYEKNLSFTGYCIELGNRERRNLDRNRSRGI
ncbi:hypothetical protein [Chitinophaga sancti]|uniref:Uncharacterized protein n=1 Tax=Chitinophaga sancti TaxID=1004 RepID=A0A1K1SU87_9BACT|nr:hypothetical protein [Chitinophaga sancti]WQD65393.1 hypothetical protein U0033_13410 [Chitinophaga sancti]WQG88983.1 hypothetical protein SR876_29060 [Chitinophaga sancti]SFW87413.1 hypothetical protein SAMN05661012_06079 [Chitinophaga sancti]